MLKPFNHVCMISSALLLLMTGCTQKNENADMGWQSVQQNKILTVATSGTLYPASYYSEENQLTGYDVEVIGEVADRLGLKIVFKEYNIDGMLAALKNQSVDLAANDFSLTKEREQNFALSVPIKYSFGGIVVRSSDHSEIETLRDLRGKKVAGEASTTYMKLAEKYEAQPVYYSNASNDRYLMDVASGRTDAILNDYYLLKMSLLALPNISVEILKDVYFNETNSGFLYARNNDLLREKINQELLEMQAEGRLSEISNKFFGSDVSLKNQQMVLSVDES